MKAMRLAWLVVLGIAIGHGTARAHTRLDRADPAPDAVLDAPPARIRLAFTTTFQVPPDAVVVLGPDGTRVDRRDAALDPGDPRALEAGLDAARPGVYTVRWSVLSRDGHPVRGEYTFTVAEREAAAALPAAGPPAAGSPLGGSGLVLPSSPGGPAAPAEGQSPALPGEGGSSASPALVASLGLHLLGLALVLAPIVLALLSADLSDAPLRRRFWQASVAGALVLLVAAPGAFVARAAALGGSPAAALRPDMLLALLAGAWGRLWAARLLLTLGLLVLGAATLARLRRADAGGTGSLRPEGIALALGLLVLLLTSSSGHAAAAEPAWLFVLFDWVHLGAAMAWAGGLVVIAAVVFPEIRRRAPGEQVRVLGTLVPRFSRMALGCVVVLVLTGLLPTWAHVGGPAALFSTGYGRALVAKLALVAVVLAPAAYNRFVVRPLLVRADPPAGGAPEAGDPRALVGRFRRSLALEAALGTTILVLAALLASLPPGR